MNKALFLIISALGGILLIVACVAAGAVLGISYQKNIDLALIEKTDSIINSLSSGVVSSIGLVGQVVKIEGSEITISYNNKNITFSATDKINISSLREKPLSDTASDNQDFLSQYYSASKLNDIKIGDTISVGVKMLSGGGLQAYSIVIIEKAP